LELGGGEFEPWLESMLVFFLTFCGMWEDENLKAN